MAVQEADKASKTIFVVFKATLAEYEIEISDVAGETTDSGPDVKAMCTNILLAKTRHPVGLVYARFNGRDIDLLAAEAAIDVIQNTVIHPDGMTIY